MTGHNLKWKQAELAEITTLVKKYPVIAIADLSGLPSNIFQATRKKLAGKAVVKVSKVRVIKRAFEAAGEKSVLKSNANKSCAVIFTDMNPFKLYSFIKQNKGKIAAKEGSIAPKDIVIPEGDTGLPPGPALSELKGAGLKVKVQGATIAVLEDKVVAKAGEPIKKEVANVLSKLDIKPIEIGLKIAAAYEDGTVYAPDTLDIDELEVFNNFKQAHSEAFGLCLAIGYTTKDTVTFLVKKSYRQAKAVALKAEVYSKETTPVFLARAEAVAEKLKSNVKE